MLANDIQHITGRPPTNYADRWSDSTNTRSVHTAHYSSLAAYALQEANNAAPYAAIPQVEESHIQWQLSFAHTWAVWHLVINLGILIGGVVLMLSDMLAGAGVVIAVYSFSALALASMALRFNDSALPNGAAILLLLADILAVIAGMVLIGPRLDLFLLLPGALIATALLSDRVLVIVGSIVGFSSYVLMLVFGRMINFSPLLGLDSMALRIITAVIGAIGFLLFLIALTVVLQRFRVILAQNAAYAHYLKVADRHARVHRTTIDADAIALQNELSRALQGELPHAVATCEELASLAHTMNVVSLRIPGLLHDREERLRLEKAIHGAITALEKGWAGFDWQWPAPSGTSVDRLVGLLRPSDPTFTAN